MPKRCTLHSVQIGVENMSVVNEEKAMGVTTKEPPAGRRWLTSSDILKEGDWFHEFSYGIGLPTMCVGERADRYGKAEGIYSRAIPDTSPAQPTPPEGRRWLGGYEIVQEGDWFHGPLGTRLAAFTGIRADHILNPSGLPLYSRSLYTAPELPEGWELAESQPRKVKQGDWFLSGHDHDDPTPRPNNPPFPLRSCSSTFEDRIRWIVKRVDKQPKETPKAARYIDPAIVAPFYVELLRLGWVEAKDTYEVARTHAEKMLSFIK